MTNKKQRTACTLIPSSYGYRGVAVTQFKYTDPMRIYGLNFDSVAGVLSIQTASNGVIQCVLRYLPPAQVAKLCDAVHYAFTNKHFVCLASVPQAGPRWFCGIIHSDDWEQKQQKIESESDPRPWSTWKA